MVDKGKIMFHPQPFAEGSQEEIQHLMGYVTLYTTTKLIWSFPDVEVHESINSVTREPIDG